MKKKKLKLVSQITKGYIRSRTVKLSKQNDLPLNTSQHDSAPCTSSGCVLQLYKVSSVSVPLLVREIWTD